jgi:hypothetical protein
MSGPLGGMPVGKTLSAQVATNVVPAGERQRPAIYITGVTENVRRFIVDMDLV